MNLSRAEELVLTAARTPRSAARLYFEIECELALGVWAEDVYEGAERVLLELERRFGAEIRQAPHEITSPPKLSRSADRALLAQIPAPVPRSRREGAREALRAALADLRRPPVGKTRPLFSRRVSRRRRPGAVLAIVIALAPAGFRWMTSNAGTGCPGTTTYQVDGMVDQLCVVPSGRTVCAISEPFLSPTVPLCDRRR